MVRESERVTSCRLNKAHSRASCLSANHLNLVVVNNQVLFFNIRDGPYFPTLRILHNCAAVRPSTLCSLSRRP